MPPMDGKHTYTSMADGNKKHPREHSRGLFLFVGYPKGYPILLGFE